MALYYEKLKKLEPEYFNYREMKKDKCERCGFVPEVPPQLEVDHIDGNHKNNVPENLMTLCANCHRLKTVLRGDGIFSYRYRVKT